jgi:hypothetical protein
MQEMLGIILAIVAVATNVLWYLHSRHMEKNAIELSKLLASRSLSEYSLLKKAESGITPIKGPGYDDVFEELEQ